MKSIKKKFLIKKKELTMIVFQNCILVNQKLRENIDFPSV